MKIVHLSNDEKFLPLARSLFEEAFPGQNRYLIAQPRRGAIRHVAPAPDVSHYHSQRFRSRWIARDLAAADCVVVHLMSSRFAPALRHVRADCLVVWIAGGGDYMPLIEPRLGSLLLPSTAGLVGSLQPTPRHGRLRQAWDRLMSGLRSPRKAPAVVSVAAAHRRVQRQPRRCPAAARGSAIVARRAPPHPLVHGRGHLCRRHGGDGRA